MNILIVGAAGFIGSHLARKLSEEKVVIYCQSRSYRSNSDFKWIKHDLLNDLWEDLALPHIDLVYYLAAQTSIYEARKSPIQDINSNVIALLRLLEFLKKQNKPAFIMLAGTATQVGLTNSLPIIESLIDQPITFYDLSKCTAENYLKQYINEGWINGCVMRLANVYGKSLDSQQKDRGILDKVYNQALLGKDIVLYGDGEYLRDYIYIDDVISAFTVASKFSSVINGSTFLIGSGKGITLKNAFLEVINLVKIKTGTVVNLKYSKAPKEFYAIEFRNAVIDNSKFNKITGWAPKFDFKSGIKASYELNFSG